MHIRRGDACHIPTGIDHNQHCVDTELYLEAIRAMLDTYPAITRVFVATNAGHSVIDEVRRGLHGIQVVFQGIQNRSVYACCEKEDLNCSANTQCLHTDDRLRSELNRAERTGGGRARGEGSVRVLRLSAT